MLSKIGAGLGIQSYQPKLAAFEQGKDMCDLQTWFQLEYVNKRQEKWQP